MVTISKNMVTISKNMVTISKNMVTILATYSFLYVFMNGNFCIKKNDLKC